jgi:DNA helicase-2/ATP-dependent DNA helicase PcrA
MQLSHYQKAVLDFVRRNEFGITNSEPRKHLIVEALAGAAKTTTLVEVLKLTTSFGLSSAYAMFNKATIEEMKEKKLKMKLSVDIGTAHAFGKKAYCRTFPAAVQDEDKVEHIFDRAWPELPIEGSEAEQLEATKTNRRILLVRNLVLRLVNHAKNSGIGLEGQPDISETRAWQAIIEHHDLLSDLPKNTPLDKAANLAISMAKELLKMSNDDFLTFDFSDMLYLTLLKKCQLNKFDYVLVDENQDTNLVQRLIYLAMLKPWGGCIAVGDRHQAIYGFNGASVAAMDEMQKALNANVLPLSICYRCSHAVIKEAQKIVPAIEPFEQALPGSVIEVDYKAFMLGATTAAGLRPFGSESVILSRFNAPMMSLAFALVRKGVRLRIEGRDIGKGIMDLLRKISGGYECREISTLYTVVQEYMLERCAYYTSSGRIGKAKSLEDRCNCLLAVLDHAQKEGIQPHSIETVVSRLFQNSNDKFAVRDCLTLSTIHKAKGKEWPIVYILGPDSYMPSPWVSQDWELVQEQNLIYVAVTRSQDQLIKIINCPL